jgi:hypothetical protein
MKTLKHKKLLKEVKKQHNVLVKHTLKTLKLILNEKFKQEINTLNKDLK